MPEIAFYFTNKEIETFLQKCLDMGCRFISQKRRIKEGYDEIISVQGILDTITMDQHPGFHLVHSDYFHAPLEYGSFEKAGTTLFCIQDRYGGPTIDLSIRLEKQGNNCSTILPGDIHHYPSYWNTSNWEKEPVSMDLKIIYKTLTKFIRSNCHPLKIQKTTYFIGKNAVEVLKLGGSLANLKSEELKGFLENHNHPEK